MLSESELYILQTLSLMFVTLYYMYLLHTLL